MENLQTGGVESFATNSSSTFSTGTFTDADGIVDGFGRGNTLHSNGFFQFAGVDNSSGGFGLDTSFGSGGELSLSNTSELLPLPDGRFAVTITGSFSSAGVAVDLTFFTSDGQIDSARGDNGEIPFFNFSGNDAVIDYDDGSVLVIESSRGTTQSEFRKFNPDGTLDTSFGSGGSIDVAVSFTPVIATTPDGGFVVALGNDVVRFDSNGQRNLSFETPGNVDRGNVDTGFLNAIEQLVVDDSGNIFAITDDIQTSFFGDAPAQIAKILPNGQLDFSFGSSGIATTRSIDTEVVIDSQGRFVFAEEFEDNLFQLTRINSDGSADPSFGFLAFTDSNLDGLHLEIDAFDRIVGAATSVVDRGFDAGDTRFETTQTIFRLNSDGTFDSTFANNGSAVEQLFSPIFGDSIIEDIRLTDDGRLLVLEENRVRRFNV